MGNPESIEGRHPCHLGIQGRTFERKTKRWLVRVKLYVSECLHQCPLQRP